MKKVQLGDRVTLKSFNGTVTSPSHVDDAENYWKLVGLKGRIVSNERKPDSIFQIGERVLVQFDDDIASLGLHCHNPEAANALWISLPDLKTD